MSVGIIGAAREHGQGKKERSSVHGMKNSFKRGNKNIWDKRENKQRSEVHGYFLMNRMSLSMSVLNVHLDKEVGL